MTLKSRSQKNPSADDAAVAIIAFRVLCLSPTRGQPGAWKFACTCRLDVIILPSSCAFSHSGTKGKLALCWPSCASSRRRCCPTRRRAGAKHGTRKRTRTKRGIERRACGCGDIRNKSPSQQQQEEHQQRQRRSV